MLLLLACKSAVPDSSPWIPSDDSATESRESDSDTGGAQDLFEGPHGFGWALVEHQGEVLVGNPFAGEVTSLRGEGVASGLSLGWSLGSDGETLWMGAPLDDRVLGDSEHSGPLAGGRVAAAAGHVAWTSREGVVVDGVLQQSAPPAALQWVDGELVMSWARGPEVLPDMLRAEEQGDLGYALCAGDRLALGAPSLGQVWVRDGEGWEVFEGSGRFGHALSCLGDEILVGAPVAGQVWLLRPGEEAELLHEGGDELGASVLLTSDGGAYAGAPGSASKAAGSVLRLR